MSLSTRFDVLVLGVGGMGAATVAHLAERGLAVVGVDRHDIPNALGSSHGDTRVIRKAYFEDPRYVPLLERAYTLWSELEERAGETLFVRTGCLNVGPPSHPAIVGVRESVARHALAHEVLDASEVRARFPAFLPSPSDLGVFEADAGFLRVEACTRAHARWAERRGAVLLANRGVVATSIAPHDVHVTLDDGVELRARSLVVSAGPWLAADPALEAIAAGLRLSVERQVQLYFRPHEAFPMTAPALPAFIHFAADRAFYGIPMHAEHGDAPALKVCRHHGGAEVASPDALDREVHEADVEPVRGFMREHLPGGDGPLLRARVCMYTNTPDAHFVVGHLPGHANVVVLGGFSGHGFKMASVIGEIGADLVTTGRSAFDLDLFRPDRARPD
ncbi:MAG: N-methyl-L-tryptophan oxidase [Deltaproteobacteria bacterium]|nr:N-methyl-L-tryptophan oxidase [Deltaproteobacteria bacterium]